MTLEQILAALKALPDLDAKLFAEKLNETAPELYQAVFNAGHSSASGTLKTKLEAAQAEIERLKGEIQTRDGRIKELQEDKPDVGKLEAKFQAALAAKDEEIARLTEEKEKGISEAYGLVRQTNLNVVANEIAQELHTRHGVDLDYAKFLTQKPEFLQRLEFDEKGTLKHALQSNGLAPVPVPEGKTLASVLALELKKAVPTKFIEDRSQSGTGIGNPAGSDGAIRLSPEDALDPKKYAAAQEQAQKAGVEVQIG